MGYFTEVGIGAQSNLEDAKRWYWRAAGTYSSLFSSVLFQSKSKNILTPTHSPELPQSPRKTGGSKERRVEIRVEV